MAIALALIRMHRLSKRRALSLDESVDLLVRGDFPTIDVKRLLNGIKRQEGELCRIADSSLIGSYRSESYEIVATCRLFRSSQTRLNVHRAVLALVNG